MDEKQQRISQTTINGVVLDPPDNHQSVHHSHHNNHLLRRAPSFKSSEMHAAVDLYQNNNNNNNNTHNSNGRESYKPIAGERPVYTVEQPSSARKPLNNGHHLNGGQIKPARSVEPIYAKRSNNYVQQQQQHQQQQNYASNSTSSQAPQRSVPSHRFGNPDLRASYNERMSRNHHHHSHNIQPHQGRLLHGNHHHQQGRQSQQQQQQHQVVYKSNSSLDIDHEVEMVQEVMSNVIPGGTVTSAGGSGHVAFHREFGGSHGSLDVITRQDQFGHQYHQLNHHHLNHAQQHTQQFPDIHSYDTSSMDGPSAVSTLQRKNEAGLENGSASLEGDSPKQKKKNSFFNTTKGDSSKESSSKGQKSLFKKLRGGKSDNHHHHHQESESSVVGGNNASNSSSGGGDDQHHVELDRHRRRFFSHYDIGSVCASLSPGAQLKTLERRNTTTGASAASAALRNANGDNVDKDVGDNVSNELILSCPYFRNEIGGENERKIALTRQPSTEGAQQQQQQQQQQQSQESGGNNSADSLHTPALARGVSLLDTWETNWKQGFCPYNNSAKRGNIIERLDEGATFYRNHFYGKEHQNWFGIDEHLGPVAISVRREKISSSAASGHTPLALSASLNPASNSSSSHTPLVASTSTFPSIETTSSSSSSSAAATNSSLGLGSSFGPSVDQHVYRIMVRTNELLPLRGCVLEESIPSLKASEKKIKSIPTKEVLEFVCPEIQLSSLHFGIQSGPCEEQLIRLDEAYVQNKYKVGLMYCREGQQTEEEMYNNEEGGPAFNEFLDLIGQRVRLKGFNKYKAGLCNKNDSTGLYSVYKEFPTASNENIEMMFHVSTLLPFTPNNRQQLPRKRYIGNDIVTVVFQEPGALPFIPNIKSQFQHVFIVVRAHNPCSENTQYSVAVTRSKSVPMFGPPLPKGGRFAKSKAFADFLITKIINAENAAHRSDKFVSMAVRTRQELLKDLASNYVTTNTLDSGSKFNLFGKKKDKTRPRFTPDMSSLRGALSWRVVVENCSNNRGAVNGHQHQLQLHHHHPHQVGHRFGGSSVGGQAKALNAEVEAYVAVSPDSLVIVQDNYHHDVLYITSTKAVIGWTASQNSIRIYVHQGEALVIHSKDFMLDGEDMSEISQRLKSVSNGAATQEFTLRRNQLGQLGFHVQHDGIITEVENFGYAWQTGLRQGSRLVEINKHPVTSLSHEQMVELLKTSMTVTVTVIPPHPDGQPRKGCHLNSCPYAFGALSNGGSGAEVDSGDYENVHEPQTTAAKGQQPSNSRTIFDSSGYNQVSNSRKTSYGYEDSDNNKQQHRWYEQQASSNESSPPPPLPNRVALANAASAGYKKISPTPTGNSSSSNSSPSIYQHPPPPRVTAKVKSMQNNNEKATTVKIVGGANYSQQHPLEERRSNEAKVTYLTEYELSQGTTTNNQHQPANYEYLQHERLSALKSQNEPKLGNTYTADTDSSSNSDRMMMVNNAPRSEDELSGSSSSMSPQTQRVRRVRNPPIGAPASTASSSASSSTSSAKAGTLTPSSGAGSRNQSPRTINAQTEPQQQQPYAAKKRPVARNNPNRNSANLTSSTLQEDLLKLINPDYEDMKSKLHHTTSVSIGGQQNQITSNLYKGRTKSINELSRSRSRENVSAGARFSEAVSSTPSEVSYHMARPATVLSNASTTSSPSVSSANTSARSDKLLNRRSQTTEEKEDGLPLPDDQKMDWNALVDTATKAITGSQTSTPSQTKKSTSVRLNNAEEQNNSSDAAAAAAAVNQSKNSREDGHEDDGAKSTSRKASSISATELDDRMGQLMEKVNQLESRLNSEAEQKCHLEDEVAALREENLRLQEESQTASQQLKRFTEWFFQTIDKA